MARKLPAGITKMANGLLQLRFTIDGKRYAVYGSTVKECREKEITKREAIQKGIESRKRPTMAEYVDQWMKAREKSISPSTWRIQNMELGVMLRLPIESATRKFGDIKLDSVSIEDLREVQRQLNEGNGKDIKPRKTQTVNDYMSLLGHVFRDAKKDRLIDYNPCERIEPLKRTEERARDTHHRALTLEEQAAFFGSERTKTSAYYDVFRMAILTGMRCGEIGALQHRDVRAGQLHIERTVTRDASGYYIGNNAKTEAGRRTIPINEEIREVLNHRKKVNSMLYGNTVSPTDTIFKAPEGGLLMATPADREIKTICKQLDIKPFTMHGLRATFATRAIEAGINPRTLQELLGHANFNLTMSLYGHVVEDTKRKEMERVKIVI